MSSAVQGRYIKKRHSRPALNNKITLEKKFYSHVTLVQVCSEKHCPRGWRGAATDGALESGHWGESRPLLLRQLGRHQGGRRPLRTGEYPGKLHYIYNFLILFFKGLLHEIECAGRWPG